jgi:phospholipase/carboxylesterase
MKAVDTSLFHRVLLPENSQADVHPAVLFIHGRGADEEDLLGLSATLDPRLMFISVRAPFRFEFGGYTWFEILEQGKPEHSMFKESYDKLLAFITDARATYPIDPNKLFLFGFSMGTVMSYALTLTRPELFAGVVACSGYLAEETHLEYRWNAVAGKELIITHGRFDPLIPVHAARRARLLFENAHACISYREYDMEHQISNESLTDIDAWLRQRLNTQA